ncbi:EF-hand calcium-binding domain-containing protein 7-like isoform X4 [Mizuhopecten yessoensis]|uniref:EF-hand calcium-binding domain-containing protein 7-like isoform X4 n=1 Tax=Mizuhopecten yessoensis TaxID=6573 RepID=UPI000B45D47B|nr:EF-hand calcium-binding domain-containing protein 7-like isoform X4 [Mizuhopecten yessoensis]
MSRRSSRSSISDGELILDCKAAYREVLDDIRKDITSKSVLLQALQETGRNPTERVLKKYWRSDTEGLSFDDFVDICRKEPVTSEEEIMKAFRKIDTNGDGFLSLEELFKIMTSKGEKMTRQEVREIIDEVDENGDGKLDFKERKFYYEQFCNMNKNTADQLRQQNRKRLERMERGDRKSKKSENFSDSKRGDAASMGSQISVKSNSSQRTFSDRPMSARSGKSISSQRSSRKKMGSTASIKSEFSVEDGGTSDSKRMGSSSSLRSDSTLKAAEHEEEDAMEEIPEDVDEDDDDDDDIQTSMTRASDAKRHSIQSTGSSFKRSTDSELGSRSSLMSSRGSSVHSFKTRQDPTTEVGLGQTVTDDLTTSPRTKPAASVRRLAEADTASGLHSSSVSLRKSTGSEFGSQMQRGMNKSSASVRQSLDAEKESIVQQSLTGSSASLRKSVNTRSKSNVGSSASIRESIDEELESNAQKSIRGSSTSLRSLKVEQESSTQKNISGSSTSLRRSQDAGFGSQVTVKSKQAVKPVFFSSEEESNRRREDDEEEIDEDVDDEEEVIPTSARRRSSASKSDLSSSYKSRHKSSGELTHGSHASLRSGEKDPNSTPVPAQRKTLSRSLLAEDDMPRPSPRSNKKGQSVKHVPASKLGHLADEPKNKRDWAHTSSKGCFFIDDDDGLMTHTYRLNLTEKSKVWITIQPTTTKKMIIGDTTPIDTMLLIARKRPDSEGRSVVGFTEKRDGKGKYGVMCELKAGTYNILPFTTGCHLRARHSDSSTETPLVRKDKDGKTAITKAFKKALQEIFELCDLDNNGCLSRDEFTWFTMRTSGDKVTDDEWDVVEETVELENGEITEAGFVKLNEMEADDVDDDISDLWVTLQSMGYNKDLFIDEACPFKLDVFAEGCDDAEVGLTCTGIETINNDMIIETVLEQDEGVKIKGMRDLNMYTYANDTRSTVVLDNRSNSRVKMTMDCTSSKNCKINQSHEDYNITLDPHEKQIAHHMMPMDETLDWTPRCVEAITK